MDSLYNYYLHYNPYTGYWNAVPREKANDYLNGKLGANDVLKYKNVEDLIRYITLLKNL
jgi:hypothetical protein